MLLIPLVSFSSVIYRKKPSASLQVNERETLKRPALAGGGVTVGLGEEVRERADVMTDATCDDGRSEEERVGSTSKEYGVE